MSISLPLTTLEFADKYRALGLWPDKTFAEIFVEMAERHTNKPAIIINQQQFTYGEFRTLIENLAGNLLDIGLQAGDTVAGQLPNSLEIPMLHLACNMVGLLYIPLHDSWRDLELAHLLKVSRVKLLVIPHVYRNFDHLQMMNALKPNLPDLEHIYTLADESGNKRESYGENNGDGSEKDFTELLKENNKPYSELSKYRPDPDLPAATMLSGGTTSLSKISRYSCNDLLSMISHCQISADFNEHDVIAAIAPAGTGATGYAYPILMPLLTGATAVILPRWGDPAEAIQLLKDNHCTCAVGIPTQLTKMVPLLEKQSLNDFSLFRCFINAGAPLPRETALAIETLMGCAIQSLYGATDGGTPTVTSVHDPQEKRLSTVGSVTDGCECEIWGERGNKLPSGQRGEVVWRCADKSYGYLGDDKQTAEVFTKDHFYKSGDIGEFDDNGYLRIVGRIKDMILRGGRNISPRTIEEAMMKHPLVQEIAVAAMPDALLGERACAFVQLRENGSLNFEEMIGFLKEQSLAVWQLPERLEIMDELPRSTGAKIAKNKLTEMITEKLKQEQEQENIT